MGLFDEQLTTLRSLVRDIEAASQIQTFNQEQCPTWPRGSSLVLEEDTALELGNPSLGSLMLLLWSEDPAAVDNGRVTLIGPDVDQLERSSAFCQVLIVAGRFDEPYERYRDLRDAVYNTRLDGLMVRSVASRQTAWCRISHDALKRGMTLPIIGAELLRSLSELEFVDAAETLLITAGKETIEKLRPLADMLGNIVGALIKMHEEPLLQCDSCDYREICEGVAELKRIRRELRTGADR
ncbi:MAG: hypothetical protein P9M14_17155 [Candidatus Alcyoniella australis]|nr:hypothetical protein [Candidatus Alcyoniella australis]